MSNNKLNTNTDIEANQQNKVILDKQSTHPKYIYEKLNKYVQGQESAKKSLSVILYQQFIRYRKKLTDAKKTNCLLIGPSGSGKTYMTSILAKTLDMAFISIPATSIVQHGYHGSMYASDIIRQLKDAAENYEKAEYGIVMIDEIDKIAAVNEHNDSTVCNLGVQQDLLCLIDGCTSYEQSTSFYSSCFDTRNVLFIFSGAFQKLTQQSNYIKNTNHSAIINYGFLPELANRFGTIIPFTSLSEKHLRCIVEKEVGNYNHYLTLTEKEKGVHVELIMSTLNLADNLLMGARVVQTAVQQFYEDLIFNSPHNQKVLEILKTFDGEIVFDEDIEL